ncbi:unnamed protein product, partial [Porites lobata]
IIPLINRPTRITAHSATLIDNIFTNNVRCKHFNGIVINDISDHLPVFVYEVDETEIASKNSQTKYLTKRDFSERNKSNFRLSLSRVNWNLRFDESDTNECYNSFKAKNNLKETWKLISDVINKPSRKAALPNSFFSDGKLLNDPQEIANCFL